MSAKAGHTATVEEAQDLVDQLMALTALRLLGYIIYRHIQRHKNTTDDKILFLIGVTTRKSQGPTRTPTVVQRDHMAVRF